MRLNNLRNFLGFFISYYFFTLTILLQCIHKKGCKRDYVFRMLAEAGYLKSTRKLELQRVIVRAELRSLLEEHYKQRIKRSMEVSVWTR